MKNKNLLNRQLISSKELARRVGYTNDYISRLCRFGKIEGEKIGNTWYVDELSLKKFIDLQENQNKDWNGELSKQRKIEYQGDQSNLSKEARSSFLTFGRITAMLGVLIVVASISTAFSMTGSTMPSLLIPAHVAMSASTQSAASILSEASNIFTDASVSAIDGVKTAFASFIRAAGSLRGTNQSPLPAGTDSKSVTVKSTTNSILPFVNKINTTQSVLGATLLGINTSATINGALRVSGSSAFSGGVSIGGSATINGALRVSGSSALSGRLQALGGIDTNGADISAGSATISGALRVSGSSVLDGRLQALGGIDTNNADINAGSGRVFAANVINAITAGENVTVTGTPQNPIISSLAASSVVNNITQVTEVKEIRVGGGSRVTSVGLSVPTFLSVSGSPITSSGTFDISYSGVALPVDNGGTGLSSIADAAILATNANNVLTAVTAGASQSIRRNAGNTAWESFTPSTGGSGTVGSGTTGQFPYYAGAGTTLTATSSLFLATSGNIGIGTTTPNWLLQVAGTRPSLALSDSSAGTDLKHWLFSSMGGNLYIGTSTDAYATSTPAALTVLNSGMVGIGIAVPTRVLDVNGSVRLSGGYSSTATNNIDAPSGSNINLRPGGNIALVAQATTNNIGIGTSSPYSRLSVWGANTTAGVRVFELTNSASTTLMFMDNAGTGYFSGNIGIGTTTPGSLLSLGNTGNDTINISATATSTFGSGLNIRTGCFAINGSCLSVAGLGGLTAVTGTWPIISSGGATPNITWGGLSTTTNAVIGNIPYFSGANTFANVATSSLAVGTGLTSSGTLGYQVGGTNSSISFAAIAANSLWANATGGSAVPTAIATSSLGIAISDTIGTLAIARGGTGQTSFAQGWLHSNGATLTSSTSPTVNYITATSTTATSTFAGGVRVTGGGVMINTLDCSGYLNSGKLTVGANGSVTCSDDNGGAGGGISTYLGLTDTPSSYTANAIQYANAGATALTQSSSLTFDGTKFITNYASTTALTVSGQGYFGTASTTNLIVSSVRSALVLTSSTGLAGAYAGATCPGALIQSINADGTVTCASSGAGTGGGSVTSVAQTVPSFLSISGSPITTSGTLAITLSGTALPVSSGGTGQTTFTSGQLLYGNGTTALSSVATSSISVGTGISVTSGTLGSQIGGTNVTLGIANNALTLAQLPQISAGFILGNNTGVTANVTSFATSSLFGTGTGGQVLAWNNGVPQWVATSSINNGVTAVTGTWPIISSGGTTPNLTWGGLSTSTAAVIGNIPYFSGANTFANVATTTPTLGLGLSYSGTLGSFVGGAAGSLTIATSSLYAGTTGQFPYFSGTNTLTATSSLFLATSGNVGIASSSPWGQFSINPNGITGPAFAIGSSTKTDFIVTNGGNVGIGTTSPSYKLDVNGIVRNYGLITQNIALSGSYGSIITATVGSSTGYTNFSGGIGTGGADSIGGPFNNALRLTHTGNLVNIGSIQGGETLLTKSGTFATKVDYTTGLNPDGSAFGDLNGDGKADLVVANFGTITISVLMNSGTGTFAAKVDYTVGSGPYSVSIGDLNGDGKADLAVANKNDAAVSVLMNNGNGTFAAKVDYTVGSGPNSVSIGDLNGDGKADLVVANTTGTSVSVLMNNGTGTFATKVDYTTGTSPKSVSIGDLNGDGKADLAVANFGATSVSILMNNGTGTFATKVDYTTGSAPNSVSIGDLNGDGKADLAVANNTATSVSILMNNGNGTFATKVDYTTGTAPYTVSIGDLNGDGKADLAVANDTSGTVSVLMNNGTGTFATKVDYTAGTGPNSASIGDLNGDGKADLAVVNYGSSNVSVFLNQSQTMFYAQASTGNTGIGTSTPYSKLTIWGAGTGTGQTFSVINNASTTLMQILDNGNVGIGTTTPSQKLDVVGSINISAGSAYMYNGANVITALIPLGSYSFGGAGNLTMTGTFNTAVGLNALINDTSGLSNTAIGAYALALNTSGGTNTAVGKHALFSNTTGYQNTALGSNALYNLNITANDGSGNNTAIGYNTGIGIVTGVNNTILGANVEGLASALSNNIIIADGSGNQRINVGSTGNVGIGTTSPYSLLSLSNSATTAVNTPLFTIASTTGGTSTSTLMTVLANGNVGIGTAAPTYALDINRGSNYPVNAVSNAYGLLRLESTDGGSEGWLSVVLANTAAPFKIVTSNSSPITLDPGGSERVRVTSAGNFGIGTTTPNSRLSVAGAGYFAGNLNLDSFSSYQLAGVTVLSATSTTGNTLVGLFAGGSIVSTSTDATSGNLNTALGYEALRYATSTDYNTAVGYQSLRGSIGGDNSGNQNTAVGYGALASNTVGSNNSALGAEALNTNTIGSNNVAIGRQVLYSNTQGAANVGIGWRTLYSNITGGNNVGIGYQTLGSNTTGSNNVATGVQALFSNITGSSNTANGERSLYYNGSATSSSALGYYAAAGTAAYNNQGGVYLGYQSGYSAATNSDYNTLVGYRSGYGITTGARNVFLGNSTITASFNQVTTGSNNISIGNDVAVASATASNQLNIGNLIYGTNLNGTGSTLSTGNIGIGTTTPGSTLSVAGAGYFAGNLNLDSFSSYRLAGQTVLSATSTTFNTLVGILAGNNIISTSTDVTSGLRNTALGYEALRYATSTDGNTAVGYQALSMSSSGTADNSGNQNTAVGHTALYANTTGSSNTANGYAALFANTTGTNNTAIGMGALNVNSTGTSNTATGVAALIANTTGGGNTASGVQALISNTTGSNNTASGLYAISSNTTGSNNVGIGKSALYNNVSATSSTALGFSAAEGIAAYNNQGGVYLGYQSGYSAATNSDYNTLVGYQSGYGITTGARNVFLGNSTLATSYNQVTTGSNNISIGNDVAVASATASNQLNIGNLIYGTNLNGTGSTLSTGNIGIGTTTPHRALTIANAGANNQLAFVDTGASTNQRIGTIGFSRGQFNFNVDNDAYASTTRMVINSSGNVGIGTTSPYSLLSLSNSATTAVNTPLFTIASTTGGTSTSTLMTVLANGNVGIGIAAPGYKLDTRSNGVNVIVSGGAGTGNYGVMIAASSRGTLAAPTATQAGDILGVFGNTGYGTTGFPATSRASMYSSAAENWTDTAQGSQLRFETTPIGSATAADRLTITSSGNVGIGTTTPTSLYGGIFASAGPIFIGGVPATATSTFEGNVQVRGTLQIGTGSLYLTQTSINASNGALTLSSIATSTITNSLSLGGKLIATGLSSDSTTIGIPGVLCLSSGNEMVKLAGVATCIVSSQRFKNTIAPSTTGLATVLQMQPVSFLYNGDTGLMGTQLGFIAEEVEKIDPRLVVHGTDGLPFSVRYENYTAVLTKAIQELDAKFLIPNGSSDLASTTLSSAVLTADGKGIDLYKLATYSVSEIAGLAARMDAQEVRVTSLETRIAALESGAISTSSGTPMFSTTSLASAFEGFGVLIQKGIAQFNTLVFRQLVASKDADGTSSAGSVTLLAGNTVAQVNNSLVSPSTKVFVTFNSQIIGSWWVSDKATGSFRVVLSSPQDADVSFDFFLVQTEGQIATPTPDGIQGSTLNPNPQGRTLSSDTVPPVITLLGDNPLRISIGGAFIDPGVTVIDAVDGPTPYVTFINGTQEEVSAATIDTASQTTYIITYSATDTAGNFSTAVRSIIVGGASLSPQESGPDVAVSTSVSTTTSADTTLPVVTLIGAAAMQIGEGQTFTDPGATAADDIDGDLTAKIVVAGAVDTATTGLYTLTYSATDTAGNVGSVSRVVTVVASSTSSI